MMRTQLYSTSQITTNLPGGSIASLVYDQTAVECAKDLTRKKEARRHDGSD